MTHADNCPFCKIVAGELPATTVHETERTLAFRDLNPKAPTHILVIPKNHYETPAETAAADDTLFGEIINQAHQCALNDNVAESGYRLTLNVGTDGGQTVYHMHCHVLGGRSMTWPPG